MSSTLARFKIHTDGFSDHFKDAIWDLSVMVIVNIRGVQKSEGNPQPKTEHNMVFQEPVWIVGLVPSNIWTLIRIIKYRLIIKPIV